MQKKFEKTSEEWTMFTDFWNMCQRNWVPDETPEYWGQVLEDIRVFTNKHTSKFAIEWTKVLIADLEERIKGEV